MLLLLLLLLRHIGGNSNAGLDPIEVDYGHLTFEMRSVEWVLLSPWGREKQLPASPLAAAGPSAHSGQEEARAAAGATAAAKPASDAIMDGLVAWVSQLKLPGTS